jgi:hypothetical protein
LFAHENQQAGLIENISNLPPQEALGQCAKMLMLFAQSDSRANKLQKLAKIIEKSANTLIAERLAFEQKLRTQERILREMKQSSKPNLVASKTETQPLKKALPKLNLEAVQSNPDSKVKRLKRVDFQDEFMSKYDEFSKSWRDGIDNHRKP